MKIYKKYKYFLDKDGYWKVILKNNHIFVVALDDSKIIGNKYIVMSKNNEKICIEYINIITKNSRNKFINLF